MYGPQYLSAGALITSSELTLTLPRKEKFRLFAPRSDEIDLYWETAAPLIKKALDRGSNYTLEDIYEGLKASEMQLWMWGSEAALVTTIQNRDGLRWCLFLALGGEKLDEWAEYLPLVEEWARSNGCDEMRIYGRAGWKKLGFDVVYTKLVRKL